MIRPDVSLHAKSTLDTWKQMQRYKEGTDEVVLDGNSLDIASVVAVARCLVKPTISRDDKLRKQIDLSVRALQEYLEQKYVVYGVNTGFGGSADVRTDKWLENQMGVLQHTQSAIMTSLDKSPDINSERKPSHVMPLEWVRGAMVSRANQSIRGHSSVRLKVLQMLIELLHHDIIPLVPLRGTISASGDLAPMSYIAGAITGNPDVLVQIGKRQSAKVVSSTEALRMSALPPSDLGHREALGLINGTAPSVSLASLVVYNAQQLAVLAEVLTALASESLGGNVEWAAPFIHHVRPHAGQIEVAANIRSFLAGSKFVVGLESRKRTGDGLWQDRYSIRTSPQWIGPYLQDLDLAERQIKVELNSTSDNPLVDASEEDGQAVGEVYSGGNFQAAAVTSAMEKTRLALQMIGRMLFSQVSEMINPATNNGLEANLNASDKENFTMKGIDVNMSAYMSELAALAHPVSSHITSAEMHNQGINSLALLSARRTMEAADLVTQMCACHIYVSCQAVDLRARHQLFLKTLHDKVLFDATENRLFCILGLREPAAEELGKTIFAVVELAWYKNNTGSWKDRIVPTVDAITTPVMQFLIAEEVFCPIITLAVFMDNFHKIVSDTAASIFDSDMGLRPVDVASKLGQGTAPLYTLVRTKLGVPMHCGIDDDPLYNAAKNPPVENKKTIGSWVSIVYEGLTTGNIMDAVMTAIDGLIE
ncbi:hypothetical protein F66182_2332 [Fusarium sp. NRRL 66182]|nr:hypothetical protein F66182_2332 [Fusarium sp. NRRL 66182]